MFEWKSWLGFAIAGVIAIVAALATVVIIAVIVRQASRRRKGAQPLLSKARYPFRLLVLIVAVWIAFALTFPDPAWKPDLNHALLIVAIIAAT